MGQQHFNPYRGGSGIHEFYSVTLTGLTILLKEVVIKEMPMIRVVQQKHGGQDLQHSGVLLLEDKQTWEGRTVISPHFDHKKVLTIINTYGF